MFDWILKRSGFYLSACRIGNRFVERADCLSSASEAKNAIAVAGEQGLLMIFSDFEVLEDFVLDFFDGYPEDYL